MYLQDKERGIAEYEATPKKGPLANEELQNYLEKKHSTEDALLCYDKVLKTHTIDSIIIINKQVS